MAATKAECEELVTKLQRIFSRMIASFDTVEDNGEYMIWIVSQEAIDDFGPAQVSPYLPSGDWQVGQRNAESRAMVFTIHKDAD